MNNQVVGVAKIVTGQTASTVVRNGATCDGICIIGPPAVDAGTYVLSVSHDGITFATLHDGTADVAPPGAAKARIYLGFKFIFIKITGPSAAADRNFIVISI